MDASRLINATRAVIVEAQRFDEMRARGRLERKLARDVRNEFVAQGRAVVVQLRRYSAEFNRRKAAIRESDVPNRYDLAVRIALLGMSPSMADVLAEFHEAAARKGIEKMARDVGVLPGIAFADPDLLAIAYASENAAAQVTLIDETTRKRLNTLLRDAIARNDGWDRVAADIVAMFADFSKARARNIAAYEIGAAYEHGKEAQISHLEGQGVRFEEKWLHSRDERVRDDHVERGALGWVARGTFDDDPPPTDPRCRCLRLYRVVDE